MSKLINCATGNFTNSATWQVCDTNGDNIETLTGTTAVTTSYQYSAAFTPGAITVDGVILLMTARNGTTGTMSVELYNDTDATSVVTTTINCNDLPAGQARIFIHWGNQSLTAGKNYKIGVKTSSASQVTLERASASAGDWSKCLRTATTGAPAAGDYLYILAEFNGTDSANVYTVTMDNNTSDAFAKIYGGGWADARSTLTWKTNGNTELRLGNGVAAGILMESGADCNIGTSGSKIGAAYTAAIKYTNASEGKLLETVADGTINWHGDDGRGTAWCRLAADAAMGATSLTLDTDVSTKWKNGDKLCIGSTSATYSECESVTMGADSNGTSLPTVGALSYAHEGGGTLADIKAEIGNLTRNVQFSTTSSAYNILIAGSGNHTGKWAQIVDAGKTSHAYYITTTGTVDSEFNSIYDSTHAGTSSRGLYLSTAAGNNTVSNNIIYNGAFDESISIRPTSGSHTVNHNLTMYGTYSSGSGFNLADIGSTFTNNAACGFRNNGMEFSESNKTYGTNSGNVSHSNSNTGINLGNTASLDNVLGSGTVVYRNNYGILNSSTVNSTITLTSVSSFQNTTYNLIFSYTSPIALNSCTLNASAKYPTTVAVNISGAAGGMSLSNCDLSSGVTAGIVVAGTMTAGITAYNCLFPDVPITSWSGLTWNENYNSAITFRSSKHNQTAGKYWFACTYGNIRDGATYRTSAPSEEITPSDASNKIHSAVKRVGVINGANTTVSVWIYKSAAYDGNQPRLRLLANTVAGTSLTTLATATGGTGSWEQLTGTISTHTNTCQVEVMVDCDGTAGTLSLSDWAVS